ncbi:MAG TPA: hypothetical protein VN982_09550 [Candidatus Dormibacteraeota bacterium]|nr:hypothetical protein [Candidatus Dormibacteraeota bacterium]
MEFRIPPETHLERLKLAAMYLSLQRGLRRSGWQSIGWGAFTLILGLLSRSHTIFDAIWFAIGVFLLIEGAWILRAAETDPRVLKFEAAALLLLGLFNTVGLYFEIHSGIKPLFGARIIIVGIIQLFSAFTTFNSYPSYKKIYEHLDRACLHELELMIGDAWDQKTDSGSDVVEFKIDDKKCKAKFISELVIILTNKGKGITVSEPGKVRIENHGNKMLSKSLKVELTLEDVKVKTEMKQECLDRWLAWLSQSTAPKVLA